MIFSHEDDDIRAFRESPTRKMQLKEIATVFRGKAVASLSDSGNVGVINRFAAEIFSAITHRKSSHILVSVTIGCEKRA